MRSRGSTADARAMLTARIAEAQNLSPERAEELANRILMGPDDIARSALEWAHTGTMPSDPTVLGESPASLSDRFAPSQVFTGLILLRSDPQTGFRVVNRGLDRVSGADTDRRPLPNDFLKESRYA